MTYVKSKEVKKGNPDSATKAIVLMPKVIDFRICFKIDPEISQSRKLYLTHKQRVIYMYAFSGITVAKCQTRT